MKRRAFKLLPFLLAIVGGAIISVAVAWGFLYFLETSNRALHDTAVTRWLNTVHLRNGVMNSRCSAASSAGAHLVQINGSSQTVSGLHQVNAIVAGWPALCFEGEELSNEEQVRGRFIVTS